MGMFFGIIGFLGIAISIVALIVKAIMRKSKKGAEIALAASFAVLILGLVIDLNGDKSDRSNQASVEAQAEASVNRSIPDDYGETTSEKIEEDTSEEASTEIVAEDSTRNSLSDQKEEVTDDKDAAAEELAVIDTKEITEKEVTENTTEITTESTTEVTTEEITTEEAVPEYDYVLNTNTGKFHKPSCNSVNQMKEKNKQEFHGTRDEVIDMGYVPCKNCNP